MTLSTTASRVSYAGTGSPGPFAFPFRALSSADLRITRRSSIGVETTLVNGTDYSVAGVGNASGTVTLTTALAVGESLVIRRKPALTQPTSIRNQGPYFPATHEDVFDRLTMQIQAMQDELDRSVKLKESVAGLAGLVELEPETGKVVVGTGTGFTLATLDAGAIALPGGGRTVASLTAYLANNAVANLKDFGAADNADIAGPFGLAKTALPSGGHILVPPTTNQYILNSQLSTPDGTPYVIVGHGAQSKIRKNFNGDIISLGKLSEMDNVYFDGAGATFTGRGIIISTGANDTTSWRNVRNCWVMDTASYCLEFTAAIAGFMSMVRGCRFRVYNSTTYAIKLPTAAEANGNREFLHCIAPSGPLIDLAGSQNTGVIGCESGGAVANDAVKWSVDTKKARVIGNRFATGGGPDMHIMGNEHIVTDNVSASNFIVDPGAGNCVVRDNGYASTVTDNSGGNNNNISDAGFTPYTPVWTCASGAAPVLGNGSLNANYSRDNRTIDLWIEFQAGTTTTFGGGQWQFSLPKAPTSGREQVTTDVVILDSGTTFYTGAFGVIYAASPTVLSLGYASPGGAITAAVPHAWATGDRLTLHIRYSIA